MKNTQYTDGFSLLPFFLFCFLWVMLPMEAACRYKIGVVHSYEKSYSDAGRYCQILEKELAANGIASEINELFMNCNELRYHDELARASFFIDELDKWGADVIVIFDNQATYSLLKCDNPKLRNIPVVFSGVYYPDEELIRQYPNVNGFVDIPDYVSNIEMIERIMGNSRIVVMSGSNMIDGHIWDSLLEQCNRAGIETYEGDLLEHVLDHRVVKNAYEEKSDEFYNERIDTTVVVRMMTESMPLRTIQVAARGSETYLMLTSRTYNSMDAFEFFANPSFAVINEGFGSNTKMLGGYFTPIEIQLREVAKSVSLRLQGEMPEQQIVQCRKEYVLNWNVLQRYGISMEDLPPEYHVMYIPFSVRYRYLILSGCVLGVVLVLSVFGYLMHSLGRERRRKKEALRKLRYKHETLSLAIEGGTTYAWRREEGGLIFDPQFYKLINHPTPFITRKQLLAFIHPDDGDRFYKDFLRSNGYSNSKEQYRCKFSGEYQWWEFRYSCFFNDKQKPVVTGLLQNIQEVEDREAELIQARYIAEQAELKQSFLNNISHEIRTPLNTIVGFSNLLINGPEISEEEKQEFVNIINVNNDLLLNLINDILELSRIDSGAVSFTRQEKDVRTLLSGYYQAFSAQVKPALNFIKDFPEENAVINVDIMRLQQVVTNFLTNANKFTDSGYIKLGYGCDSDEGTVRIFVEDTGKGIPAGELELIFSRFFKHDEFAQGTGLGLSICRSIVDKMDGSIEVESEEGKGSRFTVVLPLLK